MLYAGMRPSTPESTYLSKVQVHWNSSSTSTPAEIKSVRKSRVGWYTGEMVLTQ